MYQNSFGTIIRELRLRSNLTQAELGKIAGVSMQAISKWERGSIPDISILIVLADYFHVSLDALMGRDSHDACSPEDTAYHTVLHAPTGDAFDTAVGLCWSAMKGITGIPDIAFLNYSNSTGLENSRFRIAKDGGVAYGIVTEELQAISVMPEPKEGFQKIAGDPEALAELFHFLGNRDTMELFLFVGTRSHTLFTAGLAARETGIREARTQQILAEFVKRGWLTAESADVVNGNMTLYRSAFRENYLFFLLFAREMMQLPQFWYLSSFTSRTKPLINKDP